MKYTLVLKSFFLAVLLISCKEQTQKIAEKYPNIILILADDLGYGDISTYGQSKIKTPNIDKIAAEGVLCTDFYVPTPYCAPSRATLLTGKFPLHHGLVHNPTPDASVKVDTIGLAPEQITMAEYMKAVGYKTKAIGKWHLGHHKKFFPVNQGFDSYYGILYSNDMRPVQIIKDLDTVATKVNQANLTKNYTQKAIEFITENKENPFFLYLSYAMPHKPLAASEDFYTPETPNDLYQDVIRELDHAVGEVMESLKEQHLLDNTIVIFMSDNGPWFGGDTGGFTGMKAENWEGGIRVPFMIRYPKIFESGLKVNKPVWSGDILPTVYRLTTNSHLPDTSLIDGQDVTEALKGNTIQERPIFSMKNGHLKTVRKGDYKLFISRPNYFQEKKWEGWIDPRGPDGLTILAPVIGQATPKDYPGKKAKVSKANIQLFNLRKDPFELNNIADKYPKLVEDLLLECNNYIEKTNKN